MLWTIVDALVYLIKSPIKWLTFLQPWLAVYALSVLGFLVREHKEAARRGWLRKVKDLEISSL